MHTLFQKLIERRPKLAMFLIVLLCLGIQSAFTFCSRTCPGFKDDNFDAWFPYQNVDEVYFTSNAGDIDTLHFDFKYRTEEWKSSGFEGRGCSNPNAAYSGTFKKDGEKFGISVNTTGDIYGTFSIKQDPIRLDSIELATGVSFFDNNLYRQDFFNSLVLSGKQFYNVQRITADTLLFPKVRVSVIYLSKGTGLAAYEDHQSHELWVKQ